MVKAVGHPDPLGDAVHRVGNGVVEGTHELRPGDEPHLPSDVEERLAALVGDPAALRQDAVLTDAVSGATAVQGGHGWRPHAQRGADPGVIRARLVHRDVVAIRVERRG